MKITSALIRAALKERYPIKSHALLFEVGDSTGNSQARRIDAVAMGLWPSHGFEIDGIEIKISRGDFKRELEDHSKAGVIHQYCHRFWIACPKDMLKKDDLPSGWGLMEFDPETNALRIKVKPVKLNPAPPSVPFTAAMLRQAAKSYHADVDDIVKNSLAAQEQEIRERLQRDFNRRTEQYVYERKEFNKKLKEIKESTGIDMNSWTAAEDEIAAIQFAKSYIRKHGGLKQLHKQLLSLAGGLNELFDLTSSATEDHQDAGLDTPT